MDNQEQAPFDEFLGGRVRLPAHISLVKMGENRIEEILMLQDAIEEPPYKGQVFQRLPKHMRRRQMSHFDSRLPRRLRSLVGSKVKENPPKRPSRKYRRKPQNLLQDYIRRQRDKVWLETHIWHAKRFHMEERWGYKLPTQPTNKTFRSNYRASAKHCLLIDTSYYNCIELIGREKDLLEGLQTCVNPLCGLTFAAKYFLDGSREGSVVMFHPGSYPYQVIGEVTFIWKPEDAVEERTLWIWVHPAIHDEVVDCIKNIFKLIEKVSIDCESVVESKETIKLCQRNFPFSRVPVYKSEKIQMNLIKDTLNRFRLVGPLSSSVLSEALTPATHIGLPDILESSVECIEFNNDDDIMICESEHNEQSGDKGKLSDLWSWPTNESNGKEWTEIWSKQENMFQNLSKIMSPTEMPPHSILSILALDPRLTRPKKRTKSVPVSCGDVNIDEWPSCLAESLIWNPKARDACTNSIPSTWSIDQMFSTKIVPDINREGAVLPILLIQQPGCLGSDCAGYSAGWDVIFPAGWGIHLWRSLILRGARPGGLREMALIQFESMSLKHNLQPDSNAGRIEAEDICLKKRSRFLSLPPAKRPNYLKLGIPSPFLPLWSTLLNFWVEEESDKFFILRDKALLKQASQFITTSCHDLPHSTCLNLSRAIIPISIFCQNGRPTPLAHLYLPNSEDLANFKNKQLPPVEPMHNDNRRNARKALSEVHKKELKSQRRKRRKAKLALKEEESQQPMGTLMPDGYVPKAMQLVETDSQFQNEMADLWLPSVDESLSGMSNNSRKLLGYVVSGDFSMCKAQGGALGYIIFPALAQLKQMSPIILLKNTDQWQYRFATFQIIVN